jgi:hypothetical protein
MSDKHDHQKDDREEFLNAAGGDDKGIVGEFVEFMAENKLWWMTPILVVFGLLGVLLILGATGIAPFLYAMF